MEARKRGRPKSSKSAYGRCDIRLTREEEETLSNIMKITGMSKSDIMRKGLNMVDNVVKINPDLLYDNN